MSNLDHFTDQELQVVNFVLGDGYGIRAGSFVTALIDCIFKADLTNRAKLQSVFPEYVLAVDAYIHGDLHQRIMVRKKSRCA